MNTNHYRLCRVPAPGYDSRIRRDSPRNQSYELILEGSQRKYHLANEAIWRIRSSSKTVARLPSVCRVTASELICFV